MEIKREFIPPESENDLDKVVAVTERAVYVGDLDVCAGPYQREAPLLNIPKHELTPEALDPFNAHVTPSRRQMYSDNLPALSSFAVGDGSVAFDIETSVRDHRCSAAILSTKHNGLSVAEVVYKPEACRVLSEFDEHPIRRVQDVDLLAPLASQNRADRRSKRPKKHGDTKSVNKVEVRTSSLLKGLMGRAKG